MELKTFSGVTSITVARTMPPVKDTLKDAAGATTGKLSD